MLNFVIKSLFDIMHHLIYQVEGRCNQLSIFLDKDNKLVQFGATRTLASVPFSYITQLCRPLFSRDYCSLFEIRGVCQVNKH